jgi:hypothetical protein
MMNKTFGAGVRSAALGLAAATALTVASPAFAGESASSPAAKRPQAAVTAPSPALVAGIQEMFKRMPAATSVRESQDGTLALRLGGSFLNVLVAQGQPDGSFRAMCVAAPDTTKALAAPAAPAFEER